MIYQLPCINWIAFCVQNWLFYELFGRYLEYVIDIRYHWIFEDFKQFCFVCFFLGGWGRESCFVALHCDLPYRYNILMASWNAAGQDVGSRVIGQTFFKGVVGKDNWREAIRFWESQKNSLDMCTNQRNGLSADYEQVSNITIWDMMHEFIHPMFRPFPVFFREWTWMYSKISICQWWGFENDVISSQIYLFYVLF